MSVASPCLDICMSIRPRPDRTLEAHWDDVAPVDVGHADRLSELEQQIRQTLPEELDSTNHLAVYASVPPNGHGDRALRIVVQLSEGSWISFAAATPAAHPTNSLHLLTSTTLMAIAVVLFSIISVRILTAPLRKLSQAAERLGTDMSAPPLAEAGPREVRQAARAFNGMQNRIKRLVSDRMQMLAAISHDLRTPITRLRLRAEFVDDEAQRRKMLDDLAEMEAMIASVLAFIRDDAAKEDTKAVDISSVLETICSDMTDAGHSVRFERDGQAVLRCRPLALKRALTNLIDNAIKYGHSASIALTSEPAGIRIDIDDEGSGIPQELREKAFSPFYRIETSGETDGARPWRLPAQALEKLVLNGIGNFLLDRQRIAEAVETKVPVDSMEPIFTRAAVMAADLRAPTSGAQREILLHILQGSVIDQEQLCITLNAGARLGVALTRRRGSTSDRGNSYRPRRVESP